MFSAGFTVAQLKVVQEVVTLCVFVPFAILYLGEKWRWDYLWAFFCIIGAVYFVNRHDWRNGAVPAPAPALRAAQAESENP